MIKTVDYNLSLRPNYYWTIALVDQQYWTKSGVTLIRMRIVLMTNRDPSCRSISSCKDSCRTISDYAKKMYVGLCPCSIVCRTTSSIGNLGPFPTLVVGRSHGSHKLVLAQTSRTRLTWAVPCINLPPPSSSTELAGRWS